MLITISFIIAGIANGLMDSIAHYDRFKGNSFWGKEAWQNKYKNGDSAQGARFFGSTTFLVWTTDGWHLMKEVMISSLCLAFSYSRHWISPLIVYLIVRLLFGIGFCITYVKKK